jgi:hypothetical protein
MIIITMVEAVKNCNKNIFIMIMGLTTCKKTQCLQASIAVVPTERHSTSLLSMKMWPQTNIDRACSAASALSQPACPEDCNNGRMLNASLKSLEPPPRNLA